MQCYAVVDTNVIVSAVIAKNPDSPLRQVFRAMLSGDIIPLYHPEILAEYEEVLIRKKFHPKKEMIQMVLEAVRQFGVEVMPRSTGEILMDKEQVLALASKENSIMEPADIVRDPYIFELFRSTRR